MNSNVQTILTSTLMLERELDKRKKITMANGYVVNTLKGYAILQVSVIPNHGGFRFLLRTFDHPVSTDVDCDLTEIIMRDGRVYDEAEWLRVLRHKNETNSI